MAFLQLSHVFTCTYDTSVASDRSPMYIPLSYGDTVLYSSFSRQPITHSHRAHRLRLAASLVSLPLVSPPSSITLPLSRTMPPSCILTPSCTHLPSLCTPPLFRFRRRRRYHAVLHFIGAPPSPRSSVRARRRVHLPTLSVDRLISVLYQTPPSLHPCITRRRHSRRAPHTAVIFAAHHTPPSLPPCIKRLRHCLHASHAAVITSVPHTPPSLSPCIIRRRHCIMHQTPPSFLPLIPLASKAPS